MKTINVLIGIILVIVLAVVSLVTINYVGIGDYDENVVISEETGNTFDGAVTFDSLEEPFSNVTVNITIEDVSLADAPSTIIGQTTLENVSRNNITDSDIPFEISYRTLREGHTYSLSAHVDVDGDGVISGGDYLSTQHVDVPYSGVENVVEVPVELIEDNLGTTGQLLEFNGTISSINLNSSSPMILVESQEITGSGHGRGIKFVISEETVIQDPAGGLYDVTNLEEGMAVRVFAGPAMTASIPPIAQATLITLI
ncbi:YbaY family lipoprotein [Methanohalophilus profundi]|uniref:YbaY family lipoprotein n=1 Tax=Methanohalophilus profundi TaxID=2138083 RepID=UPI0013EB4275|nr:YbaY family lipoprotein [Methanohalophilus profundi]